MSTSPAISGKLLIKTLEGFGFSVVRSKGSHFFLKHKDGRCTTVPVHSGESIGIGLLSKILRDCELKKEDIFNS